MATTRRLVTSLVLATSMLGTVAFTEAETSKVELAPGTLAHFSFDDDLQGWTVEDDPGTRTTWVVTSDAAVGDGSVGTSQLESVSNSRLVSPVLTGAEGASTSVRFLAKWWTEGNNFDWVDVEVRDEGGAWEPVARLQGRGRWPLWDPVSLDLGARQAFEVSFLLHVDEYCEDHHDQSPVGPNLNPSRCGEGVWIDEVTVIPTGADADLAPAFDAEDLANEPRWSIPTNDDEAEYPLYPPLHEDPERFERQDERADALANPDFLKRYHAERGVVRDADDWWIDPYHRNWGEQRGYEMDVWVPNRYGGLLGAVMFAPTTPGPHPLVVWLDGHGSGRDVALFPLLHRLAEQGYVVLSVAPPFEGRLSKMQSTSWPAPEFCGSPEETADAWWRQPQEGGLVERGWCAGEYVEPTAPWDGSPRALADLYEHWFGAPYVFAALDAVEWALSADNPWRGLVDATRVGTAGWSAGGYAAMVTAQEDQRVDAAVMVDAYGVMPDASTATTPVLSISYDNLLEAGHTFLPNQLAVVERLATEGIDHGQVVLNDSVHWDALWLPPATSPQLLATHAQAFNDVPTANAMVKPITHHYMTAWFDHHLAGDPSAVDRLTSRVFDDTADRTAQGQGSWDPTLGNVPYTIEGRAVADHLNPVASSWVTVDGRRHDIVD